MGTSGKVLAFHRLGSVDSRLLFAVIGLLEGVVWWWVHPFSLETVSAARLGMCGVFFVSGAALAARFTWQGQAPARCGGVALGLAALVAAVTWRVWSQLPPQGAPYEGDGQRIAAWVLGAFVLLYVTVPFAQIFQGSGRLRFPYPDLFEHSWNNFFVGLVACFFTAALWAVLGIWAALFDLIGISWFGHLFGSRPFGYLCTFAVFGYGLALGRESEGVIRTLRRITLMIAQALLPLVALIALLFLAALPFTGLDPLWETGSATPLVLALLALLALFLNGVFEEGRRQPAYPRPVLRAIEAAVFVMPAYAAMGLYGTGLRVSQYGLTPQRVYALLFIGVAFVYAVGYSAAVLLRRPPWMGTLRRVNVAAAVLLAGLAVLVQLPPLDPLRLSAENQADRLRDRRVEASDFDFATLRFRLGHYGWEQLSELEAMASHPESEAIRRSIASVKAAETFWQAKAAGRADLATVRFESLPRDLRIPDGLLEAIAGGRSDLGTRLCSRDEDCLIIGADLDGDGALEYCLLAVAVSWYTACYAKREGSTWNGIGSLAYRGSGGEPSREELRAALGAGPLETRAPRYRDLAVPRGVLELVPPRSAPARD